MLREQALRSCWAADTSGVRLETHWRELLSGHSRVIHLREQGTWDEVLYGFSFQSCDHVGFEIRFLAHALRCAHLKPGQAVRSGTWGEASDYESFLAGPPERER